MTERVTNAVELVKKMRDDEKLELINQLVQDNLLGEIIEEVEDLLLFISRKNEPASDFKDFLKKLKLEGKQV